MFTKENLVDTLVHQGKRKKLAEEMAKLGIHQPSVLDAIRKIPRHWFFPKDFEQFAYRDAAFPIDHGQTISTPYTVAFQSQLIEIQKDSKVLEVGTGSGYQAAILSEMGAELYSIEYIKPLLEEAAKILTQINPKIKLYHGDGSLGLPKYAPFDAIVVTAGAPIVPDALKRQLKVGGKLVIPVGVEKENQQMIRITRNSETEFSEEKFGDFKFVPLKGNQGWEI
jgi:protein-L-isoaspartate(D-aspartate) O-methyltransferase